MMTSSNWLNEHLHVSLLIKCLIGWFIILLIRWLVDLVSVWVSDLRLMASFIHSSVHSFVHSFIDRIWTQCREEFWLMGWIIILFSSSASWYILLFWTSQSLTHSCIPCFTYRGKAGEESYLRLSIAPEECLYWTFHQPRTPSQNTRFSDDRSSTSEGNWSTKY